MKETLFGFSSLGLAALLALAPAPAEAQDLPAFCAAKPAPNEVLVFYIAYSGVIVRTADATIIIDPANLLITSDIQKLKALGVNLLFYTHGHGDHFDLPSALEIYKATEAYVAAEPGITAQLRGKIPPSRLLNAAAWKTLSADKLRLEFATGRHVGPILLLRVKAGNIRIFHGGDSNYVILKNLPSDVAILPTGDPSPTASADAAFRMAADLKPQFVVTVHGSDAQNAEFEKRVKSSLPGTTVVSPAPGKMVKLTLRPRP